MDNSLFAFIWRYSKRDQLLLLLLTVLSFPLLYATLELPKRIINDAIGSVTDNVTVSGVTMSQTQYLLVLCLLFLSAVLASGLMKMRINTYKGIVSERMLRRLRFQLLTRMMRFPLPYFQTTSQGELVSMVTAEAEPMGGLMGDALAQPVFQAGQMLTIVTFLFMQSVWFGLASIALIPLQAWLIPRLQRQINLLNKERIVEVRQLSSEIGETAAGISDLRTNGGWRYRAALLSDRLGKLYELRFRIYTKKFFMKFLNNFITQLTPFFFYLVGGYLAINGQISVGALVAGLAAYKDIAAPWKELLTYYNQVQDMSLRWQVVTERFAPKNMIDEALFDGVPESIEHLKGDVELRNVTVNDQDGQAILQDISLTIPAGSRVAVQGGTDVERAALAGVLTRETLPVRGSVTVAGRDINSLHQAQIAARIGYAHSHPYVFKGTVGQNIFMPFALRPARAGVGADLSAHQHNEALRSGGSLDAVGAEWLDPSIGDFRDRDELGNWWFGILSALGQDEIIFRRGLEFRIDSAVHAAVASEIIALRGEVWDKILSLGLQDAVFRFDPKAFNPAIPLAGNVLYAVPTRNITPENMTRESMFADLISQQGLALEAVGVGRSVMGSLAETFGRDGTDHPLFQRLGLDKDLYLRLLDVLAKDRAGGLDALGPDERFLLMTVPFTLTAEQIGDGFTDRLKEKILEVRRGHRDRLMQGVGELFVPIQPDAYFPRLSVLENALYGRVSIHAGARGQEVEDAVAQILSDHDLRWRIARLVLDQETTAGGANVPHSLHERAAFGRAVLKRPDVLLLDRVLESFDSEQRAEARRNLRSLLPDTAILFMEAEFNHPEAYDMMIELKDGRIDGLDQVSPDTDDGKDLRRKLRAIAGTDMFSKLDVRQQRLLAFSAQWYAAEPGQVIFSEGQKADSAYLCVSGQAELRWPDGDADDPAVSIIEPGRLIGDLAIISGDARQLDLVAMRRSTFLRIGAREFRDVIEHDASVAVSMLETVVGHLTNIVGFLDKAGIDMKQLAQDVEGRSLDQTQSN